MITPAVVCNAITAGITMGSIPASSGTMASNSKVKISSITDNAVTITK